MASGASVNMATRRSGMRATAYPAAKETTWKKVYSYLTQMSPKAKMGVIAAAMALIVTGGLSKTYLNSRDYRSLYPLKLDAADVREISRALSSEHIEHRIDPAGDRITVAPEQLDQARVYLAGLSLPRNRPAVSKDEAKMIRTKLEQEAAAKQALEDGLSCTLRELSPVADARVTIAVPDHSIFQSDRAAVKASVYLRMAPGEELDNETARGVASLVAHSVPDLAVDGVGIFDYYGREINARKRPEDFQDEVQREKELHLQSKLQEALAKIYGPDRVHAVVDLTLDFSEEETRRYTPGSPADDGMVQDSIQLVHEMLEGDSKKDGKKYDNLKKAVNYKYMENYFARLRKAAKIERITATVLVDGATPGEVEQIRGIVKGSIGIDETGREDAVFVSNLPWNHSDLGVWSRQPQPAPLDKGQAPTDWAPIAAAVVLTLVACGGSVRLLQKRRPVMGVTLGDAGDAQPAGIVDHLRTKTGRQHSVGADNNTRVSTMSALEALVDREPNEVARLLKTTWLSEN